MSSTVSVSVKFHIPLFTGSKLFCSCPSGEGAPNANTCPVCMGAFGSVPALNRSAMLLGILVGLSLNCSIGNKLIFDKIPCPAHCMPKGFRMAQRTAPIAKNGFIDINLGTEKKRVGIKCCRLEEGYRVDSADMYGNPDYNPCGRSIVTVETTACLSSGAQVKATLTSIISLLHFFGATIQNFDSKSIVMEICIAVGEQAARGGGTRLYMKGSADEAEFATDFEIGRQMGVLRSGCQVVCESVTFDRETHTTIACSAENFCFEGKGGVAIRDASLTPAQIHELYMKAAASIIGELPSQKLEKYTKNFGINLTYAQRISCERPYAALFEYCTAHCVNIFECAHWIASELDDILRIAEIPPYMLNMDCGKFAALMNMLGSRLVSEDGCRELLTQILINGVEPFEYAVGMGLLLITDSETITIACRVALRQNIELLRAYLTGNTRAFEQLVNAACAQLNEKSDRATVERYMQNEATCDFLAACDSGQIPIEAAFGSALDISTSAKTDRLLDMLERMPNTQAQSVLKSSRTLSRYEIEMLVQNIVDRSYAEVQEESPPPPAEVRPSFVDARPFFPEGSLMTRYFLQLNPPLPEYDAHYDRANNTEETVELPDIDEMIAQEEGK